jgi:diguanylate cyclase (GGDEF)-like protein
VSPQHHSNTRDIRRLGVTGRLFSLVLIPLVGLLVLANAMTQLRRDAADDAARIESAVEQVSRLAQARAAIFRERSYAEMAAASVAVNVPVPAFAAFVGVDIEARMGDARATVDRTVAALARDTPAAVTPDEVTAARAAVPTAPLSERTLTAGYEPLERRIEVTMQRTLAEVQGQTSDAPGGARLLAGLTALREPVRLVEVLSRQDTLLELLYLDVGDPARWQRELIEISVAERDAYDQLIELPGGPVADAARALETDPTVRSVRAAVQRTIGGDVMRFAVGISDWSRYGPFLRMAMDYSDQLTTFVATSADTVRQAATGFRTDATEQLRIWFAFSAGLVIATLAACVGLAHSVSRPLRRLAHQAAIVSGGNLDVPPLTTRGPRDIAVTSSAVNDLVDNLRLLEAKTHALADLDFEAEALAQPLPGPLGESLKRSAHMLSGSVAERDELRNHVVHQATHDALTRLPNRSAATEAVERALDRARRIDRGIAAIVIDVHDFKRINDTHGQRVGDQVLETVARRLSRSAETSSMVARLGSDEFLVVTEDVGDPEPVTQLAHRLVEAMAASMRLAGSTLTVGVCVGIAFSFDGASDADQLLAWGDLAVDRAKQRGPGAVEIYDRGLQEQLQRHVAVEAGLTRGISEGELFLQYQPVIHLPTGRMTSVEALVRWDRPGEGLQPPDSFIPVAERSDLIITLDQWVLHRAAGQLVHWRHSPALAAVDIAVNVSGRHLASQSLHRHLAELLDTTGIDPRRVIVELTETVLVDDLHGAAAQLDAIRGMGLRVALDDFGTGYTSLNHLQRLPVDIIKIDRSFVGRLGRERDRAVLSMITQLGHQLGHTITAEGVETPEQYDVLRDLGCDHAQGFWMSRPLGPEDLEAWAASEAGVSGGVVRG